MIGTKNATLLTLVLVISCPVFSVSGSFVNGLQVSELIYPPGISPYGLSYGDWSAEWWKWALSIPSDKNPINDKTGEHCDINQNNSHAWFLAGSGGGKVIRNCTIPAEKAIFFPIMDVECSYAETPTFKTETELRDCAKADQDTVRSLRLTIDGVNIENLTQYRTDSPLFNFTTPQNGLFGLNSATSQSVSDGFFVMLKPLSPGTHDITYSGILGTPIATGTQNQPEEVTYHLTIG